MKSKVSARKKVRDQVQVLTVLECVINVDEEGVLELLK